ncbi:MAG: WD40 repeat domain-containing protein [Chitinophagaceae bacterium]
MNKTRRKYKPGKKLLWFVFLLLSLFIYLGYYHLWHHSKQVNSNIYIPNKILNSHLSEIWTVKFSPDGNWLASGSVDSTIKVWNKENGKIILDIKQPNGITAIDFSPGGNLLASASYDSKVRLWKLPEGLLVKEFIGHTGTVWSASFSPDGKTIASCGEDATIKLWNAESGELVRTFHGHTRNVWDVKFSPDGNNLASGSFDKTIRIWNLTDGKLLHTLAKHSEAIVALAFSPDGKKLASTSDDKTIKLWNTNDWSLIYSLEVPEHNQAADFSPDNKLLLTGGRDKTSLGEFLQTIFGDSEYNKGVSMRLWDVQTGRLLQTFSKHSNDVNDVSFSPDGKWIAGASSDKTIALWQLSNQ